MVNRNKQFTHKKSTSGKSASYRSNKNTNTLNCNECIEQNPSLHRIDAYACYMCKIGSFLYKLPSIYGQTVITGNGRWWTVGFNAIAPCKMLVCYMLHINCCRYHCCRCTRTPGIINNYQSAIQQDRCTNNLHVREFFNAAGWCEYR